MIRRPAIPHRAKGHLTVTSTAERVCEFVVSDLDAGVSAPMLVGPSALALPHLLDSERLMELVGFLEDEFEIRIAESEVNVDNFETVESVVRMVEAKMSSDGTVPVDPGR